MDERPSSGAGQDQGGHGGGPGDDVVDLVEAADPGHRSAAARHLEAVPVGGGAGSAARGAAAGSSSARRRDRPDGADVVDLAGPAPVPGGPHAPAAQDPAAIDPEDHEELRTSAMDDDAAQHDEEGGATGAGTTSRGRRVLRPGRGRRPAGARSSRAAQPGTDRDLPVAIAVGAALAVAAIVAMTLGPAYGVAFATVVVTLCAGELFGAAQKAGHQPATLLGLVASAAIVLAAYWRGEPALPVVLVLTVVFTLLWYLVGVSRSAPSPNAGITILTVTYVGLFGSYAALMLRLPDGSGILLGTVVAVVANDVGALFAGRQFGRTPIARRISPNKSIEGALGGALASIVVSFVVLELIGLHPWSAKGGSALALGALVAVLGPIGDLVESMLKRDLAVKDMGSILPGHGGLIDRFDALLFVLPAAYYLCRLLEIA
jgi:phosphatidate cytidylyltransferase